MRTFNMFLTSPSKANNFRPLRLTALLTLFSFFLSSNAWPQPMVSLPNRILETNTSALLPERITIPEGLGTVQEIYYSKGKGNRGKGEGALIPDPLSLIPFVILIQDAHAIVDAQRNIQGLIRFFQQKYGTQLVTFEGGKGRLDPTLLRTFPDASVKKKVMKQYLEQGELTGIEMAAIFPARNHGGSASGGNPVEATYYGIEDWKLYEENYLAYLKASQNKEKILERLKDLKSQLDQERKKVYSANLNEFHEHVQVFQEENANLIGLLKYLNIVIARPPLNQWRTRQSQNYPHLAPLLELVRTQDSSHESDVEIRRLAEVFKKKYAVRLDKKGFMEFNENYQAYVTGRADSGTFLQFFIKLARSRGLKPRLTSSMQELLGNTETLSMIKGTKLFEELETFLSETEEGLISRPEERELVKKYKELRLLRGLANLELTRSEWEDVKAWGVGSGEWGVGSGEWGEKALGVRGEEWGVQLAFYHNAEAREKAMFKNMQKLLHPTPHTLLPTSGSSPRSTILIAGGFHTEGLQEKLKKEGYSYAVVTPKIHSLAGQEVYPEVMQGKLSYKKYLETSFYDAFSKASSRRLFNELNGPDFRKNLKLWRDEVIRRLSSEGRITQAGEYTKYIDSHFKTYYDKFGTQDPRLKTKDQILKAIEAELNRFGEEVTNHLWRQFEPRFKEFTKGLTRFLDRNELTSENVSSLLGRVNKSNSSLVQAVPRLALTPNLPQGESRLLMDWYRKSKLPSAIIESQAKPRLPISDRPGYLDALDELAGKTPASDLAGRPEIRDLSSQMNAVSKAVESGELAKERNVAEGLAPIVVKTAVDLGSTPTDVAKAIGQNIRNPIESPSTANSDLSDKALKELVETGAISPRAEVWSRDAEAGLCVTGDTVLAVIRTGRDKKESRGWLTVDEEEAINAVGGKVLWVERSGVGATRRPPARFAREARRAGEAGVAPTRVPTKIPIKDIRPGDFVYSLNESAGKIEPRRILALLDMGTKPVYRVTTASGRSIKTTANHPYLVKSMKGDSEFIDPRWIKVSELRVGDAIATVQSEMMNPVSPGPDHNQVSWDFFRRDAAKDILNQDRKSGGRKKERTQEDDAAPRSQRKTQDITEIGVAGNQHEGFGTNQRVDIRISGPGFQVTDVFNFMPQLFEFFTEGTWAVRINEKFHKRLGALREVLFFIGEKRGVKNTSADIFFGQGAIFLLNLFNLHSHGQGFKDDIHRSPRPSDARFSLLDERGYGDMPVKKFSIDHGFPPGRKYNTVAPRPPTSFFSKLSSRLSIVNAAYADEITISSRASSLLWDPIVSIEYTGREQVYDIEVEGTHNFIGNGIVAHNTYTQALGPTAPRAEVRATIESQFQMLIQYLKADTEAGAFSALKQMGLLQSEWVNLGLF